MNPRLSGVETSAWYLKVDQLSLNICCRECSYIGMTVTSAPIPKPLMIRPARNIPLFTEPAQMAAPMIRIPAATWIVRLRPHLSAVYAEIAAPIAEPAELTPKVAFIQHRVQTHDWVLLTIECTNIFSSTIVTRFALRSKFE